MLIITLPSTTWERAKYNNSPKLNRDTLKEMKKAKQSLLKINSLKALVSNAKNAVKNLYLKRHALAKLLHVLDIQNVKILKTF